MQTSNVLILFIVLWQVSSFELQQTLDCLNGYMKTLQNSMSPRLYEIFQKSYPNTLTTTIKHFDFTPGRQQTYIITGDIEAMWLRDSTNQFLPYMRIPKQCPKIRQLAKGLINTQASFIMTDPYTNAFKKFENPSIQRHFYLNDKTQTLIFGIPVDLCRHKQYATRAIWERKFQIDSLASFLRLAYEYSQNFKNIDFVNVEFMKALRRIMSVIDEQTKDSKYQIKNGKKFYTFFRDAKQLSKGEIKYSYANGMIKTGFRPSDDANDLPYNIPGNAMMSTYMNLVAEYILDKISILSVFKTEAKLLSRHMKEVSQIIRDSIFAYGTVEVNNKTVVLAYQVDGKGQSRLYDDSNLPSLLSLPYLKFIDKNDQWYLNTRRLILSPANPFYFERDTIKGVGSSHTPARSIWPLALITQILTTNNQDEIKNCLNSLQAHSKDNLMHQSFSVDSPSVNTRAWFAWANSFFGEMIVTLATSNPQTLQ